MTSFNVTLTPPDFVSALSTALNSGQCLDWIYGDVTLASPAVININQSVNGGGLDMHGSKIICGFTGSSSDLLTIQTPTTVPVNTQWRAFTIRNTVLVVGAGNSCRHGLVLQTLNSNGSIYGFDLTDVSAIGFGQSGIRFYGNVFEATLDGLFCADNGFAGAEFRNPTAGSGNGVISSIKVLGGDYRTNRYGLATTAETGYQEPQGIYVIGADFVANNGPGIFAGQGLALVDSCHFENNNNGTTDPSIAGAMYSYGGTWNVDYCDAPENNGKQLYALDMTSFGGTSSIRHTWCANENTWAPNKLARLSGSGGTIKVDDGVGASNFDKNGTGAFTLVIPTTSTATV